MLSIKAAPTAVTASRRSTCSVPRIGRVERRIVRADVLGMKFNSAQNPATDAQKRSDVIVTDVTDYFECQGFLASEGNYDRVNAMLKVLEPVDVLLLLAAQENDLSKVEEMLKAGGNPSAKCHLGHSVAGMGSKKPELKALVAKYTK